MFDDTADRFFADLFAAEAPAGPHTPQGSCLCGASGPGGCPQCRGERLRAVHRNVRLLLGGLSELYERGWQPADVLHASVRHFRQSRPGAVAALILSHAYAELDPARAPRVWAGQITAMAQAEPSSDAVARRYAPLLDRSAHSGYCGCGSCCACRGYCEAAGACGCGEHCRYCENFRTCPDPFAFAYPHPSARPSLSLDALLVLWDSLPDWPHLCPPPSRWAQSAPRAGGRGRDGSGWAEAARGTEGADRDGAGVRGAEGGEAVGQKVLSRIRGLLAKAESTDFPQEAEALTAKAQELITRHRVDSALLRAGGAPDTSSVHARRIHLHNPYLKQKATLLGQIAAVNTARTVWSQRLGIATVIGAPAALEQVELLFTSLLVQATRAMQAQAPRSAVPSRVAHFRRSFLTGFAVRIGERLSRAHAEAARSAADAAGVGEAALVPVFRQEEAAVREAAQRLFPRTSPTRAGKVDPEGWAAGTDAADSATLTAGGVPVGGGRPLSATRTPGRRGPGPGA